MAAIAPAMAAMPKLSIVSPASSSASASFSNATASRLPLLRCCCHAGSSNVGSSSKGVSMSNPCLGLRGVAAAVACRAHMEKSGVKERSLEEKDRDYAQGYQDAEEEEAGVGISGNGGEGGEGGEGDEEEEEEDDVFGGEASAGEEDFGEVKKILSTRVVDGGTQYLIEWKDDHPDSWEPPSNVARDVIAEYETPWWQAARKAEDLKLKEILEDEGRDVNCIDENQRTALFFAAGLGSEKCVRFLVEAGADVHWQDKDGFTALHIASGYVHTSVVKALLEFGADPELEDTKGRSALSLAQELLERTPRSNPIQFARRMALDQVVKLLDEAVYEDVEVEQILEKRTDGKTTEYLVRWSDGSEESWEPATNIGEDLVKDFEEGLEYGIAEKVLDKREVQGKIEYLVQWADSANTWEPAENVAEDVIAEFESARASEDQASEGTRESASVSVPTG